MDCWGAAIAARRSPRRSRRITSARVVALADFFPDNLAAGQDHFNKLNASLGQPPIDGKLLFRGPHAFEQLANSKDVDLIQISTPPYFHVQHLEAAVAAGKHVYCEKPVGIDIDQAKHALEIAKRVKPNQSVDVGFQCRSAPPIAALAEKIKSARWAKSPPFPAITTLPLPLRRSARAKDRMSIVCATGSGTASFPATSWSSRTFISSTSLTGCWERIPLKATATGGRNILTHYGDIWDNYQVDYTYPNNVHFTFASTQFGTDNVFDAGLKLFGAGGSADLSLRRSRSQSPAATPGRGRIQRPQRQVRASLPPTARSSIT